MRLAKDEFPAGAHVDKPEWITWFNTAELHGESGTALALLALHHDDLRDDAADHLRTAAATHSAGEQRSAALAFVRLASIHAAQLKPAEAAEATRQALDIADRLRSPRVVDTLKQLPMTLQRWKGREDIRNGNLRISALA